MMRPSRAALALLLSLCACAPKAQKAGENSAPAPEPPIVPIATEAPAGRYTLDKSHASLVFRVDHIGYSFYTGSFRRFDASLDFDPEAPEKMRVVAAIDLDSLEIPAPPAGFLETLLGPDWLNAGAFPVAAFRSTSVALLAPDQARVAGDLTFNGRTAPIDMTIRFNGGYRGMAVYDPQARIGFSAQGALSRSAFGVAHGLPPEGSKMGVGDAVAFAIEAEFNGPPME